MNATANIAGADLEVWQLKRQLPNTEPNSDHYGINIGCSKCGALVLRDEEIVMIRHGSIWSSRNLEFVSVNWNEEKWDDKKKCRYSDIRCEICHQLVGMYYFERPQNEGDNSKESKLSYPCGKILYLRQSAGGAIFNKTVLLGEKSMVESAIDNLASSKFSNSYIFSP